MKARSTATPVALAVVLCAFLGSAVGEPLGIAGAVEALAVLIHDGRHRTAELDAGDQCGARDRVSTDDRRLQLAQVAGPGEDLGRYEPAAEMKPCMRTAGMTSSGR